MEKRKINEINGLEMKYFVLKPSGNNKYAAASREAIRTYADHIYIKNTQLSKELKAWVDKEELLSMRSNILVGTLKKIAGDLHDKLPRCNHGNALKDHSGFLLAPSCGCSI